MYPTSRHGASKCPIQRNDNHDDENRRRSDGKIKRDILGGLPKMIHRVRDVDVGGENRQIRRHEQLDPKLRIVRPPKALVRNDDSCKRASSLFVGMLLSAVRRHHAAARQSLRAVRNSHATAQNPRRP